MRKLDDSRVAAFDSDRITRQYQLQSQRQFNLFYNQAQVSTFNMTSGHMPFYLPAPVGAAQTKHV